MVDGPEQSEGGSFSVEEDAAVGLRLDAFLVQQIDGMNRSEVRRLIETGHVLLNAKTPKKAGVKLRLHDRVDITIPSDPLEHPPRAEDIPLELVHTDEDLAVVNKPAGLVVHPSKGHATGTLVNGLLHHLGGLSAGGSYERPGIVHRLDMDTTGLLVVARTDAAHQDLQAQFAQRSIERSYVTVVFGPKIDDEGTMRSLYGRHPRDRKRMSSKVADGKEAVTHWKVLGRCDSMALLRVRLQTGRTHQIRAHMSDSGHPVVGDPLYGRNPVGTGPGRMAQEFAAARRMSRQALHAQYLAFTHPTTGQRCAFGSMIPDDMAALISQCFGTDALEEIQGFVP